MRSPTAPTTSAEHPDPLEQAIGSAIREARISAGLSATALAKAAQVSQPYISQLESGVASPSIQTLYRIANALHLSPQDLLPASADSGPIVVRSGAKAATPIDDRPEAAPASVLIGSPGKMIQAQLVEVTAGQDLGGYFEHDGEELLYLLSGELEVELTGSDPVLVHPGDCVWYRSTTPHRWSAVSGQARILVISAANPQRTS